MENKSQQCAKITRNSFFNFLRCYRSYPANHHKSVIESAKDGGRIWQDMSAEQRRPFIEMAEPYLRSSASPVPRRRGRPQECTDEDPCWGAGWTPSHENLRARAMSPGITTRRRKRTTTSTRRKSSMAAASTRRRGRPRKTSVNGRRRTRRSRSRSVTPMVKRSATRRRRTTTKSRTRRASTSRRRPARSRSTRRRLGSSTSRRSKSTRRRSRSTRRRSASARTPSRRRTRRARSASPAKRTRKTVRSRRRSARRGRSASPAKRTRKTVRSRRRSARRGRSASPRKRATTRRRSASKRPRRAASKPKTTRRRRRKTPAQRATSMIRQTYFADPANDTEFHIPYRTTSQTEKSFGGSCCAPAAARKPTVVASPTTHDHDDHKIMESHPATRGVCVPCKRTSSSVKYLDDRSTSVPTDYDPDAMIFGSARRSKKSVKHRSLSNLRSVRIDSDSDEADRLSI